MWETLYLLNIAEIFLQAFLHELLFDKSTAQCLFLRWMSGEPPSGLWHNITRTNDSWRKASLSSDKVVELRQRQKKDIDLLYQPQ